MSAETSSDIKPSVISAYEGPFRTVEGALDAGVVLLCDHARNALPEEYGSLGLEEAAFGRHIAYDIGAEALTEALAARLGCPAVLSGFSRLLIDPNRGEDDPTIVMRLSDGTVVPGNHPISAEEIRTRIDRFHAPYHRAIDDMLDRCQASGVQPMVFSIHSYTPVWRGVPRPWQAALLWDNDPRLNRFMIAGLRRDPALTVGDNEPYDGALKNDTMYRHATARGLSQALLEVRQDLIADDCGVQEWADRLAPLLEQANRRPDMHEIRHYGSRTDGTARKEWTHER
ncbi:MAG: N-formylglutamate amidohydrolase [Pseudomonadota bacterium]